MVMSFKGHIPYTNIPLVSLNLMAQYFLLICQQILMMFLENNYIIWLKLQGKYKRPSKRSSI